MKLVVVDLDRRTHQIEGPDGVPLMEILRASGIEIAAQCGGSCACGTCHVYVDPDWIDRLPAPKEMEATMLEMTTDVDDRSRLSCQVLSSPAHDGLRLTLAPATRV
jgi:2Fe-2S ferredoxin